MESMGLKEYLRSRPRIALVGATNNSAKFGNKIMKDLMRKGFEVVPINRKAQSVEAVPSFNTLREAQKEKSLELVVYVIPPKMTRESLEEAKALGLKKIWIQPGAADSSVREYLEENDFEYLVDECVMVET